MRANYLCCLVFVRPGCLLCTPDPYIAGQVVLNTTALHLSFLTSQESGRARPTFG